MTDPFLDDGVQHGVDLLWQVLNQQRQAILDAVDHLLKGNAQGVSA